MTGCMQGPVYMRHVCVGFLLEPAWGYLSVGLLFFFPLGLSLWRIIRFALHFTSYSSPLLD